MTPEQPMQPGQMPPEAPGYTICLHVGGDGALSVSVEPENQEMAEAQGAPEGEEQSQPVADMREAVKLILDIFKGAGHAPDAGAETQEMEAGYK